MPEDMQASGRDARLTAITAVVIGLLIILAGLQSRHNWPIGVADWGYAAAVGVVVGAYLKIYRFHAR